MLRTQALFDATATAGDWRQRLDVVVSMMREMSLQGDPEEAYTAGFACAKVNRDMETVHSPDRLRTPLRRTGPKGSGQFEPITWEAALDEMPDAAAHVTLLLSRRNFSKSP